MSHLIARILLTIFMLPLAGICYLIAVVVAERLSLFSYPNRDTKSFIGIGLFVWLLLAVYWLAVWARSVQWTSERIRWTWISAVLCAAVAGMIGFLLNAITRSDEFAAFIAATAAPLLWLVATVFVWRESREERIDRLSGSSDDALVCPVCGYNLTGLSEARCPECGARFTLNELLAAQPKREISTIERQLDT